MTPQDIQNSLFTQARDLIADMVQTLTPKTFDRVQNQIENTFEFIRTLNNQPLFQTEAEQTEIETPNMGDQPTIFEFCPVEPEPNSPDHRLIVCRSLINNEPIKNENGQEIILHITDTDQERLHLIPGSIVDVDSRGPAIVRRYTFADATDDLTFDPSVSDYPKTLADEHIAVICSEARRSAYEAAIKARGGAFTWIDANRPFPTESEQQKLDALNKSIAGSTQVLRIIEQAAPETDLPTLHICEENIGNEETAYFTIWEKAPNQLRRIVSAK